VTIWERTPSEVLAPTRGAPGGGARHCGSRGHRSEISLFRRPLRQPALFPPRLAQPATQSRTFGKGDVLKRVGVVWGPAWTDPWVRPVGLEPAGDHPVDQDERTQW
jgi:hypothetical protein